MVPAALLPLRVAPNWRGASALMSVRGPRDVVTLMSLPEPAGCARIAFVAQLRTRFAEPFVDRLPAADVLHAVAVALAPLDGREPLTAESQTVTADAVPLLMPTVGADPDAAASQTVAPADVPFGVFEPVAVVDQAVRLIAPPYCWPTSGVDPALSVAHWVSVCDAPVDGRLPDPTVWTLKSSAAEPCVVLAPLASTDHVIAVNVDPRFVV